MVMRYSGGQMFRKRKVISRIGPRITCPHCRRASVMLEPDDGDWLRCEHCGGELDRRLATPA
jgi:ribosomal protein L37AE/L43A